MTTKKVPRVARTIFTAWLSDFIFSYLFGVCCLKNVQPCYNPGVVLSETYNCSKIQGFDPMDASEGPQMTNTSDFRRELYLMHMYRLATHPEQLFWHIYVRLSSQRKPVSCSNKAQRILTQCVYV